MTDDRCWSWSGSAARDGAQHQQTWRRGLAAIAANSGVQMHEFHLAVSIRLLEDLFEVATRGVVRHVQCPGGVGERMSTDDHRADARLRWAQSELLYERTGIKVMLAIRIPCGDEHQLIDLTGLYPEHPTGRVDRHDGRMPGTWNGQGDCACGIAGIARGRLGDFPDGFRQGRAIDRLCRCKPSSFDAEASSRRGKRAGTPIAMHNSTIAIDQQ